MSMVPKPSTINPMDKVPYDVLREIFIHCLPLHPLKDRQSNSKRIAPLLLCHICSSWRTVALSSAGLWSHLWYSLTVCRGGVRSDFLKSEIEFIQWWRTNQGTIAPLVHLSVEYRYRRDIRKEWASDGMSFLLEYLMSAQYLELDPFYWYRIYYRIKAGIELSFPNLRTLAKSGWIKKPKNDPFHHAQALAQPNTFASLRYLSLTDDVLPSNSIPQIPTLWLTLTHISLHKISITLDFWHSFIRALSNLQWGYFDINDLYDFDGDAPDVSQHVLPHLSNIYIGFSDPEFNAPITPFRLLFAALHLPALRTLALSWAVSPSDRDWFCEESATINELYAVLSAMPGVTMLSLGGGFLAFNEPGSGTMTLGLGGQVAPIWKHLPHLARVQLELPSTRHTHTEEDAERALSMFVRNIFFSSRSWLDLPNPACPIRAVSVIDNDRVISHNTEAFTMAYIKKHAEKAPNVVFQLVSKTEYQIAAGASNEWGSYF